MKYQNSLIYVSFSSDKKLVLYIWARALQGTPTWIKVLQCPSMTPLIKFCMIGLVCQSYYFIYTMIFILKKRWDDLAIRKANGIKLQWFNVNEEAVALIKKHEASEREKKMK